MDLSKGNERNWQRAVRDFGERKSEQAREEDGVNAVKGRAKLFPSFKKVEPITQPKLLTRIRQAYYKYTIQPYPLRDTLELMEEDYHFIYQNGGKYKYHCYPLLNQSLLLHLLFFLRRTNNHYESVVRIKLIFQILAQNEEFPFDNPVFQAFKADQPTKCADLLRMLGQRSRYYFNRNYQFEPNNYSFIYTPYQPREKKKRRRALAKSQPLSAQLALKVHYINQSLEEYNEYVTAHRKRKALFLKAISGFFYMLREVKYFDESVVYPKVNEYSEQSAEDLVTQMIAASSKPTTKRSLSNPKTV